jgi:hypothetical protein
VLYVNVDLCLNPGMLQVGSIEFFITTLICCHICAMQSVLGLLVYQCFADGGTENSHEKFMFCFAQFTTGLV